MKNFLTTVILCLFLVFCYSYREDIVKVVMQKVNNNITPTLPEPSPYENKVDFMFVQNTDDFHAKNYQGLLNIIYTTLNNGTDDFTFYCDETYKECMNDFEKISSDQVLLSTINNLVSPYNSYEKISFKSTIYGTININVNKLYTEEEKTLSETKINEFIANNINDSMDTKSKIKAFHDFLINGSVYDQERANLIENHGDKETYRSHKAVGPLIDGIALCSGYSDAMKIFLDKIGVTNYKISNENHIWNLVYLDGNWLHLDITWDDPVTNTGENFLLYKFFLIDTNTLHTQDQTGHNYNSAYYPEVSY